MCACACSVLSVCVCVCVCVCARAWCVCAITVCARCVRLPCVRWLASRRVTSLRLWCPRQAVKMDWVHAISLMARTLRECFQPRHTGPVTHVFGSAATFPVSLPPRSGWDRPRKMQVRVVFNRRTSARWGCSVLSLALSRMCCLTTCVGELVLTLVPWRRLGTSQSAGRSRCQCTRAPPPTFWPPVVSLKRRRTCMRCFDCC